VAAPQPITLSRDLDPWERQPGESAVRFGQFSTYLGLGRMRTYAAAARELERNPVHVRQIAGAFHWKDRATAKDGEDDRLVRIRTIQDRVVATRDDAKILLTLRAKLAVYIRDLDFSTLEVADFLRLLEIVLRQGRALFGGAGDLLTLTADGEAAAAGADPFAAEVEAWAGMAPGARADQMRHLTKLASARLVAMSGLDDP
jgi:hypothetical protein